MAEASLASKDIAAPVIDPRAKRGGVTTHECDRRALPTPNRVPPPYPCWRRSFVPQGAHYPTGKHPLTLGWLPRRRPVTVPPPRPRERCPTAKTVAATPRQLEQTLSGISPPPQKEVE